MKPGLPNRRRRLLRATMRGAVYLGIAVSPYLLARGLSTPSFSHRVQSDKRLFRYDYRHPLRPMGAQPEARFLRSCIQCGICGQACPVRAVRFYGNEGGALAHTPYIQPELKGCILCGKCPPVCPSGALSPVAPEEARMGHALVDRNSCYPWVNRGICGACVSACPLGERAIGFEFAAFFRPIVKAGCVGCGVCVEVCPHPAKAIRILPPGKKEPT